MERGGEIKLILVIFGDLTKDGQHYVQSLKLPSNHLIEVYNLQRILELYLSTLSPYRGKGPNVKFSAKDIVIRKRFNLPRSIICTISGEEVAKIVNRHRYDVFQLNVREFIREYEHLPQKNKQKFELRRAFLPYSDTHILAMFGKVIREMKYRGNYDAREVYEFLKNNPEIFLKIYGKLVKILEIIIKQAKQMTGESFSPRNYLVNPQTYKVIKDTLDLHKESIEPILERFP